MTTLERKSRLILVRKQCFLRQSMYYVELGRKFLYTKFGETLFVGVQNTNTGF
jgi:hypothetical protein